MAIARRTLTAVAAVAHSLPFHGRVRGVATAAAATTYDAIIIGGGMVGAALACSLPQSLGASAKIALVEARPVSAMATPLDALPGSRVVALSASSVELFTAIGAWDAMRGRAAPFASMTVWDGRDGGAVHFAAGATQFGFVVENTVVEAALHAALALHPNVTVLAPAAVQTVSPQTAETAEALAAAVASPRRAAGSVSAMEVRLKDGTALTTPLLIGADGPGSLVRTACGIPQSRKEYGQVGIVATLHVDAPADAVAWQRFLPGGPVALLPVHSPGAASAGESLRSMVWTVSPAQARVLAGLPDAAFAAAVNAAVHAQCDGDTPAGGVTSKTLTGALRALRGRGGVFAHYTANLERALRVDRSGGGGSHSAPVAPVVPPRVTGVLAGSRASWPLSFGHAARYTAPRAALIGDAAHQIHPLAGQGANLGFADVAALARILQDAVANGEDPGAGTVLARYDDARRVSNRAMGAGVDALQRLFGSAHPLVGALRSAGLDAVDAVPALKAALARIAMASGLPASGGGGGGL